MFSLAKARPFFAVALFASVIFAPPYLSAIFAIILAARWRAWEVIAAGLFMDFLWLPQPLDVSSLSIPYATLISIALVFALEPLRRHLLIDE